MPMVQDSVEIRAPAEKVFSVLRNIELLLRLNGNWEVAMAEKPKKLLEAGDVLKFTLMRENTEYEVAVEVLEIVENERLSLRYSPGRYIAASTLALRRTAAGTELFHEANITRSENPEQELKQWQDAIKFRAELEVKRNPVSTASKYIIDRFFLKLSPSHRRIVLHIVFLNFFLFLMVIGLVATIVLSQKYGLGIGLEP